MNKSKYFDEKSYPVRRLRSHLDLLQDDIAATKTEIKAEQKFLYSYIQDKEKFYTKIRNNRKADLNK